MSTGAKTFVIDRFCLRQFEENNGNENRILYDKNEFEAKIKV